MSGESGGGGEGSREPVEHALAKTSTKKRGRGYAWAVPPGASSGEKGPGYLPGIRLHCWPPGMDRATPRADEAWRDARHPTPRLFPPSACAGSPAAIPTEPLGAIPIGRRGVLDLPDVDRETGTGSGAETPATASGERASASRGRRAPLRPPQLAAHATTGPPPPGGFSVRRRESPATRSAFGRLTPAKHDASLPTVPHRGQGKERARTTKFSMRVSQPYSMSLQLTGNGTTLPAAGASSRRASRRQGFDRALSSPASGPDAPHTQTMSWATCRRERRQAGRRGAASAALLGPPPEGAPRTRGGDGWWGDGVRGRAAQATRSRAIARRRDPDQQLEKISRARQQHSIHSPRGTSVAPLPRVIESRSHGTHCR